MSKTRFRWPATLMAVLAYAAGAGAIAADPTPDEILKSRGLTRSGVLYLLESDADLCAKVGKLQPRYQQLKGLYDNLFAIVQNQAEYDQLNHEWTLVNEQLRNVQAEIDTHPPLSSNVLRESWQNLLDRERQLRFQYNEYNTQVNLRYRKLVSEGEREKKSNEFQKRRGDFLKETRDLRSQADKIKDRYGELAKDDAVKQALGALRNSTKARLDLGPSLEFKKKSAWLINAERDTAPENFTRAKRKNSPGERQTKNGSKVKRSALPASGEGGRLD